MDFLQCVTLDEARETIRHNLESIALPVETVCLPDSLGRITATDIISADTLPQFNRSTVDGFAIRSSDSFGATEAAAALFAVNGEVLMGKETLLEVRSGQAVHMPTGGMLPAGADAVVMLEHTEQPDSETLMVQKTIAPGENVITRGEDFKAGSVVINQGVKIAPRHIGVLAACGCYQVSVREKIKVAVISSGDEIVDVQEMPSFGQIRDVNSYALEAALSQMGCEVIRMGIVRDSYEKFREILEAAVNSCHVVVISGGSSVGARDYTVEAMESLGTPGVIVHGLSVKPGKPTIFGMAGKVAVFGLPGHPVAALMVCEKIVKPAIRQISGQLIQAMEPAVLARLTRNVASAPGRDDFVNVRLEWKNGEYIAEPILGKSGLISVMGMAGGVLHVPIDKSGYYAGEMVFIVPAET